MSLQAVPSLEYRKEAVILQIGVKNSSTHGIGRLRISLEPATTDTFSVNLRPACVEFLGPGESAELAAELRPRKGDLGTVQLSGFLECINSLSLALQRSPLPKLSVEVKCPPLTPVEADERKWDVRPYRLVSIWQTTARTPVPAEEMFESVREALKGLGIFMISPHYRPSEQSSKGRIKLYGEDDVGRHYWFELELLHDQGTVWMSLKAYSEDEKALLGFYNKALDLLEQKAGVRKLVEQKREEDKSLRRMERNEKPCVQESVPNCPECQKVVGEARTCISCGAVLCASCDDRARKERRNAGDERTAGLTICIFCRGRMGPNGVGVARAEKSSMVPPEALKGTVGYHPVPEEQTTKKTCVSCGAKYDEDSKGTLGWNMCPECLDKLGQK